MGKKTEKQAAPDQEQKSRVDLETAELLENTKRKIIFIADCISSGSFELTDEGRDGLFFTLQDIVKDIESVTT